MAARDEEMLGWRRLQEGRLDEAEGHFRRCLELDPDRVEALNGLGSVYLTWNDLDEAAELFQMAIAMAEPLLPRKKRATGWQDPAVRPYLQALFSLSMTRVRRQAFADAILSLEAVMAWDSTGMDGEAYLWLGQCYHRTGNMMAARECYETARLRFPEAWFLHGLVCFVLGDGAQAVKSFRTGAEILPEVVPLLAFYPRVRGFPGKLSERHGQSVEFVDATIDLWTAPAQLQFIRAIYPDAVSSL